MAKQTHNPFLDWDVSKFTEPFAVPANRAAYEGAQAIARRQAEILREAASEAVKATRELSGAGTPQDQFVKHTQLMKQGYESAVANWRELTEMNAKSGATVVELISKRVSEGLDEMQKAVHTAS